MIGAYALALKKTDRLGLAFKGNDHHVGGFFSVGGQRMGLVWLVEQDFSLRKGDLHAVCRAKNVLLCRKDKLPEIVRLYTAAEVFVKLKIMNRDDLIHHDQILDFMTEVFFHVTIISYGFPKVK